MKNPTRSSLFSFPLALALALPLLVSSAACTSDDGDDGGSDCATSELTYTNFGEQFFADFCVGCHAPGAALPQTPSLDSYENVSAQAGRVNIRAGVGLTMPPLDPRPSAAERADLAEWLECGAPQ